jgi:RNA polymerase sigma-70 factor (ECF subfamily)
VPAVNSALQRARETLRDHLPPGRREEWSSREVSETERSVLEGFMRTHESGDVDAAMEMIREDIRVTMPPNPWLFAGHDEVRGLMESAKTMPGEWRLVPVRANRMPAAASYMRAEGETDFRPFKFDLLRIRDGKIAEITTFGPELFPAFGLPEVLPEG